MSNGTKSPENAGDRPDLEGRLARLIDDAERLGAGREQRREHLIERAEAQGLGRPEAEQAYDVASEVGLEPAYGIALVVEGISVQMLSGARPDVSAAEPAEPEWVDTPPSAADASRERRLRQTFRRLRSLLEREPDPEAAFRALAREPDLETFDY